MLSGQRSRWFVRAVTHRPLTHRRGGGARTWGTVLALRLEPSAATETLVSVLIGLAVGLRDLNPRPLLCQLAALRVVGSRPGADA